ncbi:hypothetical protein CO615_01400 [Lysobacteraceae bacterium NML75-0749]|nr:hypothetical protein CO615_01400 [Xanthomonadaceae bacterium NML75-0749]PJK04462.1 hypothetical protein CO609_05450 [Xanthomonadaceae bacterium NML91-0268]
MHTMKPLSALMFALLPATTMAQAVIVDFSNPPDEATLQQLERDGTPYQKQQAQAYRRQARRDAMMAARGLPTLQQRKQASMAAQADAKALPERLPAFDAMLARLQEAMQNMPAPMAEISRSADAAKLPTPLTRQPLLDQGCTLAFSTPSGVELRAGGLNGNLSLYRCENFYLLAHEWDYSHPLRGQVTIDASGYEKQPGSDRYKVREMTFPSGSGSVETMLSWISPGYEIRLDVYTPAGRPQYAAQLDRLTALLETLAARKQAASPTGQ